MDVHLAKMIALIEKEGLELVEGKRFAYLHGEDKISYVKNHGSGEMYSTHILAHELAHHFQFENNERRLIRLVLSEQTQFSMGLLLFYLPVLNAEFDAWVRSRKICIEQEIPLTGFYKTMWEGFSSYLV